MTMDTGCRTPVWYHSERDWSARTPVFYHWKKLDSLDDDGHGLPHTSLVPFGKGLVRAHTCLLPLEKTGQASMTMDTNCRTPVWYHSERDWSARTPVFYHWKKLDSLDDDGHGLPHTSLVPFGKGLVRAHTCLLPLEKLVSLDDDGHKLPHTCLVPFGKGLVRAHTCLLPLEKTGQPR